MRGRTYRAGLAFGVVAMITLSIVVFASTAVAISPPGMGLPFLLGILTAFAAFFFLWLRRVELASLRAELARREAEQRAASGGGSWAT